MRSGVGKYLGPILISVSVCALSVFCFLLLYNSDNKYTVKQPHASSGLLRLDSYTLDTYPVLFLIGGWEYYGGRLLRPEDFASIGPMPDQYIYIGQYGGFEAGDKSAPPHGSATYRLKIFIPEKPREYMLELPEIFSAYRVYVNGSEVPGMGVPEPGAYRPETGNRTITFEAGGEIEIIIAASDFSHLYSGMTYPPAFGEPERVAKLLSSRLVIRGAACAVALTIALISILIGLISRSGKQTLLYGLLCLFFVGYISYPLLQTYYGGFQSFYAIENISFCAVLLLTMWIQYISLGQPDKWSRYFLLFGVLCCLTAAVLPFGVSTGSLAVMSVYSRLITAYEWITAAYLTFTAIRSITVKPMQGQVLLSGVLVFDNALVLDRLLPLYEPIRIGWFIEISAFAMIIAVGVVIAGEVAGKYRENVILTERANSMERLSEMQQGYFAVLRREMEETKAARHDLRHHFTVMEGFLNNKLYDDLAAYIAAYGGAAQTAGPVMYSENNVINILAHHYNTLCEQNGIHFHIRYELT